MATHEANENKDGVWRCPLCNSINDNSISHLECVMCGHGQLLTFAEEWQCSTCRLIQPKSKGLCCQHCHVKNYDLLKEFSLRIDIYSASAFFDSSATTACQLCRFSGKNRSIIWKIESNVVCDPCFNSLHNIVQEHYGGTECNIKICPHLKRLSCLMQIPVHLKHNIDCESNIMYADYDHLTKKHGGITNNETPQLCIEKTQLCNMCDKNRTGTVFWCCNFGNVCDVCYETAQQTIGALGFKSAICDVSKCYHISRYALLMDQYSNCNSNGDIHWDLLPLLNSYLHLIEKHTNNTDFEFITSRCNFCDVNSCVSFSRNNRSMFEDIESNDDEKKIALETENSFRYQIMDKMHCYFHHSYDMGYRFTRKEKNMMHNDSQSIFWRIFSHVENKIDQCSSKKSQIIKILKRKNISRTRMRKRYNQLVSNDQKQQNTVYESKHSINSLPVFRFGYLFVYGYEGENVLNPNSKISQREKHLIEYLNTKTIRVFSQYTSLKEELTTNPVSILCITQFNTEYNKSALHYNSYWKKKHHNMLTLEQIISLMVYCNYDQLQCQFSKTYRENNGRNHKYFYHFGKSLKIAIHGSGNKMRQFGCCKHQKHSFYHGISQKMIFPSYGIESDEINGIFIHGPLSTSSSFAVAVSFATSNGLVLEFADNETHNLSPEALSLAWLSDYANEKEHLFMQNLVHFRIESIIEISNGKNYKLILDALRQITGYNHRKATLFSPTIDMLVSNQLAIATSQKYGKQRSLPEYAQNIANVYFNNVNELTIEYLQWSNLDFWYNAWIKLDWICRVFPNIYTIQIIINHLKSNIFSQILSFFKWKPMLNRKMRLFVIIPRNINFQPSSSLISTFRRIDIRLGVTTDRSGKCIYFLKEPLIDSAIYFMERCSMNREMLLHEKILMQSMKTAINNKVHESIGTSIMKVLGYHNDNHEQLIFNQYCNNKRHIIIHRNDINKLFFTVNCRLNLTLLHQVFTNVFHIELNKDNLTPNEFRSYCGYLTDDMTALQSLKFVGGGNFFVTFDYNITTWRQRYPKLEINRCKGILIEKTESKFKKKI
eukprot:417289_1